MVDREEVGILMSQKEFLNHELCISHKLNILEILDKTIPSSSSLRYDEEEEGGGMVLASSMGI